MIQLSWCALNYYLIFSIRHLEYFHSILDLVMPFLNKVLDQSEHKMCLYVVSSSSLKVLMFPVVTRTVFDAIKSFSVSILRKAKHENTDLVASYKCCLLHQDLDEITSCDHKAEFIQVNEDTTVCVWCVEMKSTLSVEVMSHPKIFPDKKEQHL